MYRTWTKGYNTQLYNVGLKIKFKTPFLKMHVIVVNIGCVEVYL